MATDLIGRQRELDELVDRLDEHRLITVVGPGGIGKTTLARAVAARRGDSYPLGAHFVDLSGVDEDDAVGGAIAAQLGFPSFPALLAAPTEQPALLVIDNCEHVLDAAADALDALLAACESPVVVATSRSPLDLPGESVVVLGPLPLGDHDEEQGAVQLFLDRARHAGATLDDDRRDEVVELCRALDRVPLALELAAARARVMSPAEILDRIEDLDTLARPHFRGVERHRTLRATIEWSYVQLDEGDRRFFDRLGVPAGAFTAELANAVAGEPGEDLLRTVDRLEGLVRASLVVTDVDRGTTRYRLLHALRTFARERLSQGDEHDETCDRYVDHLVTTARRIGRSMREGWRAETLVEQLAFTDHVLFAIRWTVAHDEGPERPLALLASLWGVVHQGRTDDIGAAGESVLDRWPEPRGPYAAEALATVATCRHLQGRLDDAIALAESALASADPDAVPPALPRVIGMAKAAAGDAPGAAAAMAEVERIAGERGVQALVREAAIYRTTLEADPQDLGPTLDELRAMATEAAAADDNVNHLWARIVEAYLVAGTDTATATDLFDEVLADCRRARWRAGIMAALRGQARIRLAAGDVVAAAEALTELIDEVATRGAIAEHRGILWIAAGILHAAGDPRWPDLAATAERLPRISLFSHVGPKVELPPSDGRPLATGDAINRAREALLAVQTGAGAPPPTTGPAPSPTEATGTFRQEGDLWRIAWAGREITMRRSKGLADLAQLVARPGQEVHCLELAGAGAEQSGTGEVIDETARREYEQRIRDLQADIDEAEANNDHARADKAQAEFDAIVEHLAGALGLGGRSRRTGSTAERARSAVTHRIRATIRRLGDELPELGRHLEASVTTGTYCRYQPEHPVSWET